MGIVYRGATDAGGAVAVKVLRGALASTDLVRRFEREARVRVDHPNVVQIVDAGADDEGTPRIAFELLEGRSLAERLLDGLLSSEETVRSPEQAEGRVGVGPRSDPWSLGAVLYECLTGTSGGGRAYRRCPAR